MLDYFSSRNYDALVKLREIVQSQLPSFCNEYFIGISNNTSPLTRLGYARDLSLFFNYLTTVNFNFKGFEIDKFLMKDLALVSPSDIEQFLEYISYYKDENGKVHTNNDKAKARKLSTIRSMFKYFYNKEDLEYDVSAKVSRPKLHEKEIIRLDLHETERMLTYVDSGTGLSKHQQDFHKITQLRDTAMITLFLGTGIRISECVGLNIEDVNIPNREFTVTRKGGNRVILYMSEDVAIALDRYLIERNNNPKIDKKERAFFVSLQGKRMGVRATQKLVKKYSSIATPLKKITPHKLRSKFGNNLYNQTKEIYVVAEVLGHKVINTTKKHYAAQSEQIREDALKNVVLSPDDLKNT
ncbi:MAG: tyrosine-type recombinase/integrase [Clostridia bacterium]|nr:tyrosine-type recombinase/integrase [Clostridia bacterium]